MIKNISISNFKSIENINIDLGRVNVFIGENGAGKSNILEAIALASAAADRKLDNEFLASRGIRVADPMMMMQQFKKASKIQNIKIVIINKEGGSMTYSISNDSKPYSKWTSTSSLNIPIKTNAKISKGENEFQNIYYSLTRQKIDSNLTNADGAAMAKIFKTVYKEKNENVTAYLDAIISSGEPIKKTNDAISHFLIYSPNDSTLRDFGKDSQITPLGINGEGLFKLIYVEHNSNTKFTIGLNKFLQHFGWFESMAIPKDISSQSCIKLIDKYINQSKCTIDLRSANEGFLFLIFYYTLFQSDLTPEFFAIDNIDSTFNPKLCTALTKELCSLADRNNKQVILTTHNPAILDGLNLDNEDQRLFVVSRSEEGHTKINRVEKRTSKISGRPPQKLSELFMSGALGGLPRNF